MSALFFSYSYKHENRIFQLPLVLDLMGYSI